MFHIGTQLLRVDDARLGVSSNGMNRNEGDRLFIRRKYGNLLIIYTRTFENEVTKYIVRTHIFIDVLENQKQTHVLQ